MSTDREIALEQALIAVLGAAQDSGVSVAILANAAKGLVLDNSKYRSVEHPHVSNTCDAIDSAVAEVTAHARGFQTGFD